MSSKRNLRCRMCVGKRAYSTIRGAYAALDGHAQTFGERLGFYWCEFCRHYHLGHPLLREKRTRKNFKELL